MAEQILEVTVLAATAIVDYDLMRDIEGRTDIAPRMLAAIGLAGSGAAGDTRVRLLVNNIPRARLFNLATGWPTRDHLLPCRIPVPANAEIVLKVEDAPVTNPINAVLVFG